MIITETIPLVLTLIDGLFLLTIPFAINCPKLLKTETVQTSFSRFLNTSLRPDAITLTEPIPLRGETEVSGEKLATSERLLLMMNELLLLLC